MKIIKDRTTSYVNKQRQDLEFKNGDKVWLEVAPVVTRAPRVTISEFFSENSLKRYNYRVRKGILNVQLRLVVQSVFSFK